MSLTSALVYYLPKQCFTLPTLLPDNAWGERQDREPVSRIRAEAAHGSAARKQDRQRQRRTERERYSVERHRQTDGRTDGRTDGQTDRQRQRRTLSPYPEQASKQRQTDGRTDRQRQTNRQTDRQTDRLTKWRVFCGETRRGRAPAETNKMGLCFQ